MGKDDHRVAPDSINFTQLLADSQSDTMARDQLYGLVYTELKGIAHRQLGNERANHTLQTTALTNEAFLKLAGQDRVDWQSRAQFFAIAARAIRRLLVDYARQRNRLKRGAGAANLRIELADNVPAPAPTLDLVALDDALTRLKAEAPAECEVVELRYFTGLTNQEVAEVLDVSSRTVERRWRYAKAWLFRDLQDGATGVSA